MTKRIDSYKVRRYEEGGVRVVWLETSFKGWIDTKMECEAMIYEAKPFGGTTEGSWQVHYGSVDECYELKEVVKEEGFDSFEQKKPYSEALEMID